ncbi:hypothetical protein GEMRC1_010755 [Eukaryota sp. GEM-RC1]
MSFADEDGDQPRRSLQPTPDVDSEYNTLYSDISQKLQHVTSSTNRYQQFLQQVGTPKDSIDLRQRAAALARSTTNDLNSLAQLITKLSRKQITDSHQASKRSVEKKRLMSSLQQAQQRFNTVHQDWCRETAKHVLNPIATQGTKATDERQALLEAQRAEQEQMQSQILHNKSLIEETEQDVEGITRDLHKINHMYRDIVTLVKDQEGYVDSLDSHIEITEQQTQSAANHLERASGRQRRSRGKICCLLLLVLAMVAVVLFLHFRETPPKVTFN